MLAWGSLFMYCDYHTHTPLCLHASGTPQEYVQSAVRAGLREYGISDHAPMQEEPFDDWRMKQTDVEDAWEQYWKRFRDMAASGLFHILGHADLIKKFGFRPGGDLRRYYEPALEAISRSGACLEINTAGWYNKCAEQYPDELFLRLAAEMDIPLTISSDAHEPGRVQAVGLLYCRKNAVIPPDRNLSSFFHGINVRPPGGLLRPPAWQSCSAYAPHQKSEFPPPEESAH